VKNKRVGVAAVAGIAGAMTLVGFLLGHAPGASATVSWLGEAKLEGNTFTPVATPTGISEAQAVQAAERVAPLPVGAAIASAQEFRFSSSSMNGFPPTAVKGDPAFRATQPIRSASPLTGARASNVPVWVVTYTGVNIHVPGGVTRPGATARPPVFHTEHIVLDAVTGTVLFAESWYR
jgi:hypothetical protein